MTTYHVITNQTGYTLANAAGDLARTTEGGVYVARTRGEAEEAAAFLSQRRVGIEPRRGNHRLKSMFGTV